MPNSEHNASLLDRPNQLAIQGERRNPNNGRISFDMGPTETQKGESMRKRICWLAAVVVALTVGSRAMAAEQVVTIYFAGTGCTEDWWDPAQAHDPLSVTGFWSAEVVATLHHLQNVTSPTQHKIFIDGMGTGEGLDLLAQMTPALFEFLVRGWHEVLAETKSAVDNTLSAADPDDTVVLNLIGFSRGGVSTVMFAHEVENNPAWASLGDRVSRINIMAFDPVPGIIDVAAVSSFMHLGDGGLMNAYVGLYATDERTMMFSPVLPDTTAMTPQNVWMFRVPGSHETMVGNHQVDGHSTNWNWACDYFLGIPLPWTCAEAYNSDLLDVSWVSKVLAVELLGSPAWGNVSISWPWDAGLSEAARRSQFVTTVTQMWGHDYSKTRTTSLLAGAVLESWRNEWPFGTACWGFDTLIGTNWFGLSNYPRCVDTFTSDDPPVGVLGPMALPPLAGSTGWTKLMDFSNPDIDGDGVDDYADNCPQAANPDQSDTDGDLIGDACDDDADQDGITDSEDNCPLTANPGQADADGDDVGDTCDDDDDNDTVADLDDNCPLTPNADQTDTDFDGLGNLCDMDDDNDGVMDTIDNCPLTANTEQADFDGDGSGDVCDADIDGDGVDNGTDACESTEAGALINPSDGCSLAQLCPCDAPWRNHGKYVSCVADNARMFNGLGLLTRREKGQTTSAAARSTWCK
jgi:hypothetical protein